MIFFDEDSQVYRSDEDNRVFCPVCFTQRNEYIEMDQELSWGQQVLVPVYWSNLGAGVLATCPDCGFVARFSPSTLPPPGNEDDSWYSESDETL